ncbi:hypothetical protein SK128_005930 [Halocaridina rubra]|uniref:Laminin G domain-containing protein n=1 Tax=Halocaridina rubra TaxID=373956 RepID=A0AAN8ZX03_HALRR
MSTYPRSNHVIEEGVWHRVLATWQGGRASLRVNQDPPVSCEAPGPPTTLTLNTPLYLGGFKLWYMVNRESGILVGLDGALQRLLVNGVVYDRLTEAAIEQKGVTLYKGPPCHPNPCHNSAICVPLLNEFFCKCSFMFVGRLCDQANFYGTGFGIPFLSLIGSFSLSSSNEFLNNTLNR